LTGVSNAKMAATAGKSADQSSSKTMDSKTLSAKLSRSCVLSCLSELMNQMSSQSQSQTTENPFTQRQAEELHRFISSDVEYCANHVPFYQTSSGLTSNPRLRRKFNLLLNDTVSHQGSQPSHGNENNSQINGAANGSTGEVNNGTRNGRTNGKNDQCSEAGAMFGDHQHCQPQFEMPVQIWGLTAWMLHIFLKQIIAGDELKSRFNLRPDAYSTPVKPSPPQISPSNQDQETPRSRL